MLSRGYALATDPVLQRQVPEWTCEGKLMLDRSDRGKMLRLIIALDTMLRLAAPGCERKKALRYR